jgi:cytochrome b
MKPQAMIKVWDPLVRAFHWILVLAFITAYFTEDDFLTPHVYAGYTVLGLILLRLVWGVVGGRYARFSSFVTRPGVAWQYFKDALRFRAKRYLGHNPAGGAMIVLLLVSLLLTTITGLAAYGASETAGPLAGWLGHIGETGEDIIKEIHEFFANLSVFLVVVHVGGVLFESLAHRENLVRAMLNGYKPAGQHGDKEQV